MQIASRANKQFMLAAALAMLLWGSTVTAEDPVIASGAFEGQSGHTTLGTVTIKKTSDGVVVVLESDFSFDGAPDPKLGFGNNGYDQSTTFSALKSNKGAQTYVVPTSVDLADYNEIYVWCEQYNVPLGKARLQK